MNKIIEGSTEMKEVNDFYKKISRRVISLENFAYLFISQNPEWENAIADGIYDFQTSFVSIKSEKSVQNSAKYLKLPVDIVILANKISLSMLLGVSHYLSWANFDIQDPTNYNEVTTKLKFTRIALVNIGFTLAIRDKKSKIRERLEIYHIKNGMRIGVAIGYLTSIAYHEGSEKAIGILDKL